MNLFKKIYSRLKQLKERNRIYRKTRVDMSKLLALKVNEQLERFKNIYSGKDIYIVGCGNTEKYFENTNDSDAIYIGINRAFFDKRISFDFLFAQDYFEDGWEEFAKYNPESCTKMLAWITSEDKILIRNSDANKTKCYRYVLDSHRMGDLPYDISCQPFADLRGTVFSAIQFALYTNPKRIFLVGFDCTKGNIYSNSTDDYTYQHIAWNIIHDYIQTFWKDTELISINPIGLIGLFTDVFTDSFLSAS